MATDQHSNHAGFVKISGHMLTVHINIRCFETKAIHCIISQNNQIQNPTRERYSSAGCLNGIVLPKNISHNIYPLKSRRKKIFCRPTQNFLQCFGKQESYRPTTSLNFKSSRKELAFAREGNHCNS